MKRVLRLGVVAGLVFACVGGFLAFGDGAIGSPTAQDEETERPPPLVEVVPVQVAAMASHIEATTNLVAEHQVTVAAEIGGKVTRLHVEEGALLERGDAIASLNGRSARLAVESAKIKRSGAIATHKRAEALAGQRLVSDEELEKATTDGNLAHQELTQAKWELSRRRVAAPITGRVTKRHVQVGQFVSIGDPLVEVTDFSTLLARIHIAERDAMRLELGREVQFVLQADSSIKFAGYVRRVAEVVDTQSGTVEVTLEVQDAPTGVRSGSFVGVRLVRERVDAARWLPREAVIRTPSGAHVFVLVGEAVERRPVELGLEQSGIVEIKSGVQTGERVVLAGHGNLEDGASVRLE